MSNELGGANKRALKQLEKIAAKVEALADKYAAMNDGQLREMTDVFRRRLAEGEELDSLLPDAYAACREAADRVLRMRHFHVQVLGGIALHQGRICQMSTGEGKTLVETLPAYLNALKGEGVHIVTVNEYLAKRDAEWMGKVFHFLGLSVGVILNRQNLEQKKEAYRCDITYGTNNEFGFDYLRDNMARSKDARVQRGLKFAIIDEVDSILIDEARTPLIISGRSSKSSDMYVTANRFICTLQPNVDYEVDEEVKQAQLLDSGIEKAERFFKIENLADMENTELNHYIIQALRAHAIMKRDNDYIVENGKVVIVDAFTGRKMEGRRFSSGLHQAIEAKEHVAIKEEDKTLATITFQNYFRLYSKLSGMTGTAKTEESEFNTIYNLDVVVIPTNLPMIRKDNEDRVYVTRQGKLRNIVKEVEERHAAGQPILIGTVSVEKSEELSAMLDKKGIRHNVLNAKNHSREAEIVAQAGRFGAVTIATNMAGRGTDILLGGNPKFLATQEMMRLGYNEEQISTATSYAEGDEETAKLQAVYEELYQKNKEITDLEKQKVIEAGGLHIIGTERHESRRIDNQLRGRSGRQGDPGSSVFFLSTEDDMMRVFGGDRMRAVLSMMKVDEDTPITAKILSNQLEAAQKRVEDKNFSARKYVLQYDDVNNYQRNIIYAERNKVLEGGSVHGDILKMAQIYARRALEDACHGEEQTSKWDWEKVNNILKYKYMYDGRDVLTQHIVEHDTAREILDRITATVSEMLENKRGELTAEGIDFDDVERYILLKVTDEKWMEHLENMEQLKQGVGLQSIGHHDPLAIYKKEGFDLFEKMNEEIQFETVKFLLYAHVKKQEKSQTVLQKVKQRVEGQPIGMNEPCPCGSGKKYKNCCGAAEAAKQKEEWKNRKKQQ